MEMEKFFELIEAGEDRPRIGCIESACTQLEDFGGDFAMTDTGELIAWGGRWGVGFTHATLREVDGGLVQVVVPMGAKVCLDKVPVLRKIFRKHNSHFKVTGLSVADDGAAAFVSEPFDPVNSRFTADRVVSLALSTVHAYQGVLLALDAGVEPWDLIAYGNDDDDDTPGVSLERFASILHARRTQDDAAEPLAN